MGIFAQSLIEPGEVTGFVPQREPMLMVDAFYGEAGNEAVAGLTVREENLFVENGFLSETGLIEHIAQSAALQHGVACRKRGMPPPVGYIGAIQDFELHALPSVGENLRTSVRVEQEIMGITLVSARVESEGRLLAACKMKIFVNA